ncbi:DUF4184 family protein [Streptomyces sp. 2A115]|uniref:DUF4184 family protein n=1 Tax=Streptomyces sp. 2A115 TaxID=3457439 RepID=UPI003FD3B016
MPFTLSHAAAVLPALRTDGTGRGRLIPAALVAGSFAPDMTYYAASALPEAMEFGEFTHSFTGVLTVDVLITWALVGAWLVLREPLVALLPRGRQGRIGSLLHCGSPRARFRPALALWWYVSAVLGALTHVVWDAFTHLDRWGMRVFPVLGREIAGSPLYWYLQYGGSAVAAAVIAAFVVVALRRLPAMDPAAEPEGAPLETQLGMTPGGPLGTPAGVPVLSVRDRWLSWLVIGGCAAVAGVQRAARWWAYWGAEAELWELIPTVCFGAGAGLAVGLTVYAVAVRVWRPAPAGPSRAAARTEPSRPTSR